MKCFTHRDTDAMALCRHCGKGLMLGASGSFITRGVKTRDGG